jgi:putative cardiolipin synthase
MTTKTIIYHLLTINLLLVIILIPKLVFADSIKLLEDPHEAWLARINLIEQAQNTIEVEYYAIEPDTTGKVFVGSLLEAADRGVKVRILVGGLTHSSIPDDAIGALVMHPNVELRFHNSLEQWYKPSHWLKALHDKVLLVDDKYLISGGRNIADKYFDMTPPEKKQTIDRDIIYVGDPTSDNIPMQVKKYFNELWVSKNVSITPTQKHLTKPCTGSAKFLYNDFFVCVIHKWYLYKKMPETELALRQFLQNYKKEYPDQFNNNIDWKQETKPVKSIRFVHDPTDKPKMYNNGTALALTEEFKKAKKSILYFTPYIVKTDTYLDIAKTAQENGVTQTVLTNSPYSGANTFGMAGTERDYKDFHKFGLTYWTWQGFHSLHHKTYIIDDHITISSTYNYDPRSQNLNTEMLFIIDDENFTKIVQQANQVFFDNALQLDDNGDTIAREGVKESQTNFITNLILFTIKIFLPVIRWAI